MKKSILPLLLCAVLLCGCGEKPLAVQEQYRTVLSADMEAEVVSRTASDDRTGRDSPSPRSRHRRS